MHTRSDDLEIVIAVADCGGFSNAAQQLEMQVAKVSRAVSRVEQQLQASLFVRTTRKVILTDEGRSFIEGVRAGLNQLQLAEEQLRGLGTLPAGRLRVDAASPFVLHQLVPLINEFACVYPDIELELSSNEGYVDLLAQRTDVAIRIGGLDDSTLIAKPLGASKLFLVAAPDYLNTHGVPTDVKQLQRHRLIGFSGNKVLNRWPLNDGLMIEPQLACTNGEVIRQLALAGNGIACLSGFMVQQDIDAGRLVAVMDADIQSQPQREQVNAVFYQASSARLRINAFLDFIQPRLTL